MLRTAAAAGVTQVLLSKECAFAWSPKALRAGQGAHFLTTVVEDVDLCAWSAAFRAGGGHVVALVARAGRNLYDSDIDWPAVFAFCEGKGKTEWYVVEHETSKDPLDAVKRTFESLKKLGKVQAL